MPIKLAKINFKNRKLVENSAHFPALLITSYAANNDNDVASIGISL